MPTLNVRLAALLLVVAGSVKAADQDLFERPASLQPAIEFWTRVYSEVDSLSGFIHDSRNLAVVYDVVRLNWYDSPQVQERRIDRAMKKYREALRALAAGKREGLTAREQKVLTLWGAEADRDKLAAAVDRVRFQRGQSDRIRDGVIRAGAWEQRIRKTLRDHGLPEELAMLPHVESSYNPNVHSHAGAAGLWQFTRFTGRHYLRVDHIVDERLDPVKSTEGAARLLQRYYSRLQSWPLTITAYNHGLSGVRRAVRETGSRDIGDIVQQYDGPRFGFASRNYYAAFLAASDVARNAEAYFGPLERQQVRDHWIVKMRSYVPVTDLMQQLGLDEEDIKAINPALQQAVWSGQKHVPKGYPLRIPADTANERIRALLTRVDGHEKQIPDLFYRVQAGDTLSGIALRHKQTVRELIALNNLRSGNRILAGQRLRLSAVSAADRVQVADKKSGSDGGEPVLLPASDVSSGVSVAAVP